MSELQAVLEDLDVEEWLDFHNVDWRRTSGGDNLQLRSCPFCLSDDWRVYLSRSKRLGICFKADCPKKNFNIYSFARQLLECSNAATARHFLEYAGVSAHRPAAPRPAYTPPAAGDWSLPASGPSPSPEGATHPYLLARGVLPATQRLFGLRWCEEGVYTYEDVEGRPKRLWFGGRILLPICDLDGTMATFVGRDATGAAEIRYLFPPLLPSAGRHLLGAERLAGTRHLVLGEGPFDAIAIHQAICDHPEFRGAAASCSFGVSLGHADPGGDDQLGRLLKLRASGLARVTLLWDGEAKALRAALGAAETLSRHGLNPHLALMPQDADPGEVETRVVRDAIQAARPWSPALQLEWTLASPYRAGS